MYSYILKYIKGEPTIIKRIDGDVLNTLPVSTDMLPKLLKRGIIEDNYVILHYAKFECPVLEDLLL